MTANILSIGDELLIGQTLNTNAHWIAQQLTAIGITVNHIIDLSDDADDIKKMLDYSIKEADVILITGGLGPTNDDITRDVLCDYFDSELITDEKTLENLKNIFINKKRILTDEVLDLAKIPKKAKTLYNTMGTAPGMLFQQDGKVIVSMPGVPYEMRGMMEMDVLPWIKDNLSLPIIVNEHILTAGRGESQLAQKIKIIEANLPSFIKLAYLPGIGMVKLRLTGKGSDKKAIENAIGLEKNKILKEIGHYVYGFNNETLEGSIGNILKDKNLKIGTAESCTGGTIAAKLTSVSGSSAYFEGSIVSYSNAIKMKALNVSEKNLKTYGAVSEPVVKQMILGAIEALGIDVAIAVSGVAGPTGGTEEKPVGTVYIGVGNTENQFIKRFEFTTMRDKNIEISAIVALVMIRKFLLEQY